MHIPDGYLGPQTYAAAYAVTLPFWAVASRKLGRTLKSRQVPLLALGAAFSFVIMMFNVPIPGGTTGHAVGAVLVAVLLGPWAACIAVSMALIIQALLFGDGGFLCIGANCINMAVVMPFVGFAVYRLIAGNSDAKSARHWTGAAVGAYVGMNAAALSTAFMLGIQPIISHDALGRPLYAPIPLKIAIPAMAIGHLLFIGVIEAVITGLVIAYLQKADPSLIQAPRAERGGTGEVKTTRKLLIGLLLLILLSPLGLILPARFGAGSAWGEWSNQEIRHIVGYVPRGMERTSGVWKAPMPDYAAKGQGKASIRTLSISYIISAVVGVALVMTLALLVGKILAKRE